MGFFVIHQLVSLPNGFHQRPDTVYAADADGKLNIRIAIYRGAADRILHITHFQRKSFFLNLGKDDQKLVPAIPNQHIRASDTGENGGGDLFERNVTDRMTVGIVDLLEAIHVDHHHAVQILQRGVMVFKILTAICAGQAVRVKIPTVFFEHQLSAMRIEPNARIRT